ncbi:OB-fold domain-containing protein [uncultured Sphingosinicella sp.]|uniref:Zn-ribbon domain-containing OB-fold protein n=1 Tax=uncultured Sphingosinicella sp. TaxID=478748 RepID=UPI0030D7E8EA|tara:strand:- start:21720 stop:22049 length:330 start_codon:yes stop_codon:yes gene_type:complete
MTIHLQTCTACGAHQYPERDLCRTCLHDTLVRIENDGQGRLLAATTLHRSLEPDTALPLRIGTVALDADVRVIAFLGDGVQPGDRVALKAAADAAQHQVFTAEKDPADA